MLPLHAKEVYSMEEKNVKIYESDKETKSGKDTRGDKDSKNTKNCK